MKTIGGSVVNTAGAPLPSKTVTLYNDATDATITTTTTNADGEWEFANRDETLRYRAEAAMGGSSAQVVVRKPASAEFDHLYANTSFRSASGATVALGGSLTVANGITVTAGGAAITGPTTITGALGVSGNLALTGASSIVELGSTAGANTPGFDFHSSGNANDYDVRVLASGGAAGVGLGTLSITAATVAQSGALTVGGTLGVTGATTLSGVLTIPVGSVGAPSLTFAGDADNGVYRIGTNNWAAAVGGVKTIDLGGANATTDLFTTATSKVPLRISGIAAQSADMFQIRNSANTLLFAVEANGQVDVLGAINMSGSVGFYGTSPIGGPLVVSGSRASGAALVSLLTALTNCGLIDNTTTA